MNPALLMLVLLAGTTLLLLGMLSAVFHWLPLTVALVLGGMGLVIETVAALAFARSRQLRPSSGHARR
jgi:hypothetical protein